MSLLNQYTCNGILTLLLLCRFDYSPFGGETAGILGKAPSVSVGEGVRGEG